MNKFKRIRVTGKLKRIESTIKNIEAVLPELKVKFEDTQAELSEYKEEALTRNNELNNLDPKSLEYKVAKKDYSVFQSKFKIVTKKASKISEKYNSLLIKVENLQLNAKYLKLDLEGELHETHSDIMRYKNNTSSFWLCILAICLNVAMFLIIYKDKNCTPDVQLGLDLLINILVLLAAFLIAERTKTYNVKGGYFAIGLGVVELLRIFWIPLRYYLVYIESLNTETVTGLTTSKFVWCVALLICGAISLISAGLICLQKSKRLTEHLKNIENGGK